MKETSQHYEPLTFQVTHQEAGWTIRDVMRRRMGISRKHLSRLKLTDGVKLNGVSAYVSRFVQPGDIVEAQMEAEESNDILPQPMELDILLEDEDILVLNKPAGRIVHPTHGHYTDTLANGIMYHWKSNGQLHRFRPVHRLDQDTSGVLLIAKNKHAHHVLSEQWQANQVKKEYWAIVSGIVRNDKGTIDAPIDRDPEDPKKRIVLPSGYPSITHYSVVERFLDSTWVKLILETGRTHQIRVHMKHLGHPLIGDEFYGGDTSRGMKRQALHAFSLAFNHPRTSQPIQMQSPMPDDMRYLIKQ